MENFTSPSLLEMLGFADIFANLPGISIFLTVFSVLAIAALVIMAIINQLFKGD